MRRAILTAVVASALLGACVPRIAEVPPAQRPSDFPEQEYRRAAEAGKPVFEVDASASIAVIEVRRAGSLARLGHDHVVASHDVRGYVLEDAGRSDLYVRLDRLSVDEPTLRAEAAFDTQPSEEAVAGTRRNMLEKVLEVERYPFAVVHVDRVDTDGGRSTAHGSLTIHGVTRPIAVPVEIRHDADDLAVSGRLTVTQSDFGITPLSILGGAIQVRDLVEMRFRIRAHRISGGLRLDRFQQPIE